MASDLDLWGEITASSDDDVARALLRDKHEVEIDEQLWNPIGNDTAPCPADYLLVATAGCQVEVLRQCFHKARIDDYDIHMRVSRDWTDPGDVPEGYPDHTSIRYSGIDMELTVETTPEYEARVQRCLDVCEDACIVSRSVEAGVPIHLEKSLVVASDE